MIPAAVTTVTTTLMLFNLVHVYTKTNEIYFSLNFLVTDTNEILEEFCLQFDRFVYK